MVQQQGFFANVLTTGKGKDVWIVLGLSVALIKL